MAAKFRRFQDEGDFFLKVQEQHEPFLPYLPKLAKTHQGVLEPAEERSLLKQDQSDNELLDPTPFQFSVEQGLEGALRAELEVV